MLFNANAITTWKFKVNYNRIAHLSLWTINVNTHFELRIKPCLEWVLPAFNLNRFLSDLGMLFSLKVDVDVGKRPWIEI